MSVVDSPQVGPVALDPAAAADDPSWRRCLAGIGARTLFAFDYDGTLAPIVPAIDQAWMSDGTQAAFARLLGVAGARVAIVSGRESHDVQRYVAGLAPLAPGYIIGNHGADRLEPNDFAPRFAIWRPQLAAAVARVPGAELEEKTLGFSLHWRKSPDPAQAEQLLGAAARALVDAQIIGGKLVFNVLPKEAPHKGHALARLAEDAGFEHVLFVGDDVTDELAFGHEHSALFTGIRVGPLPDSGTRAGYWLPDQHAVDGLLRRITEILHDLAPASSVAG